MDPDYLRYESFENLYANEQLSWGLLCFNQAHQKQEVLNLTIDADKILSLLKRGWEKHTGRNQYILRAPEKALCDLSEKEVNPTDNPELLVDYYTFLNEVNLSFLLTEIKKENREIQDLMIIPLNSHIFTTEVRVAGSDQRVKIIPDLTFKYYLKEKGIKTNPLLNKKMPRKLKNMDDPIKNYYLEISKRYRGLGYEIPPNPEVPKMEFWPKFAKGYDVYVFIPKSAIKYCLSFLDELGPQYITKTCLWEYHTGNDINKELVMFKKDIRGKSVLLTDRSFSSYTLTHLAQKIEENGAKKVTRLAISPKSQVAVTNSEYCFFWNSLLKSSEIDLRGNWVLRLFKKVNNL